MAHWRRAAHRLLLVAMGGGVMAIGLLACGGEPRARPAERPAAHRAAPHHIIDLVPLTGFLGPDPTWRLLADGRLESAALDEAGKPTGVWSPGPRLSADGTIHFPRPPFPQAVSARVTAGGEILPCPGQPAWGRIDGEVVTFASGGPYRFRIDPSGTITLEGSQPPETIAGAVDARSRRTALVAYAALILSISAAYVGEGGTTWCP